MSYSCLEFKDWTWDSFLIHVLDERQVTFSKKESSCRREDGSERKKATYSRSRPGWEWSRGTPSLLALFPIACCHKWPEPSHLESFLGSAIFHMIWAIQYFMTSHFSWESLRNNFLNDESEIHFVLCSFVCWGQDPVDITSSLGHQELELPEWHVTHSFICQRPWRLYICPLLLKLLFIEPLTKVLIYLDSVSRIMPVPHPIPSFLFPSKWSRAGALCWWILHVLLVPLMLVYIVYPQDYCSLSVEGLHGAPQAPESFWNLSSTFLGTLIATREDVGNQWSESSHFDSGSVIFIIQLQS